MRLLAALLLALTPIAAPAAPGLDPLIGAQVDAAAPLTDAEGRQARFKELLDPGGTLLVLGYHRCTNICGVIQRELAERLMDVPAPPRVLFASLDPGERPEDARAMRGKLRETVPRADLGQREINSLHVPVGRPVVVELTSQDVIHSFFIPAVRVKQDAVPGRATRLWFEATETGRFHLFCAEFCGAEHSGMRGEIVAMEPEEYAAWLEERPEGETLAARGRRLYTAVGCSGCHERGGQVEAPVPSGLYRRPVGLASGEVVVADRQYIWDSILRPERQIVAGFRPIMPSYNGLLEETEVTALVSYIQSLSRGEEE